MPIPSIQNTPNYLLAPQTHGHKC